MLENLEIGGNNLTGKIPPTIGNLSNLVILGGSGNKLIGEIPPSIWKLSSLVFVDLSSNLLEGVVPNCVGNFSQGLQALNLNYNNLHGPIPTTFAKGCSLKLLSLESNEFGGTFPQSLANCTQLKVLDVGANKIEGHFPDWLETLSELHIFNVNNNKFHGTIPEPKDMLSLAKLSIFDVSQNGFTGRLPTGYFNNFGENRSKEKEVLEYILMPFTTYTFSVEIRMSGDLYWKGKRRVFIMVQAALTIIDMSNNKFYGNIPDSFGNFTALKHLNLSRNDLSGYIPRNLNLLTALEALDLSSNHLEGAIPRQLVNLTFLSKFNVSYNNLSGEIPFTRQFSTFEYDSYIGNLELCGGPLTKKCRKEGEQALGLSSIVQREEGEYKSIFNGITWQGIMMGYGFGVIVGLSWASYIFDMVRG